MTERTFVDSNILIYAHDKYAGPKQRIAALRLNELWKHGSGVISPQVMQEFYVNSTRKLSVPLSKQEAQDILVDFSPWCVATTMSEVYSACQIEDEARINFWDALIVASACTAGATRILSEDMNHGQEISGVRIENPFAELAKD